MSYCRTTHHLACDCRERYVAKLQDVYEAAAAYIDATEACDDIGSTWTVLRDAVLAAKRVKP